MKNKIDEQWKKLSDGYIISNLGRVYSQKTNKFLKPNRNNSGYERVQIYINNQRKHIFVHIKVVEKFGDKNGKMIPSYIDSLTDIGLSIDHIDGRKSNNSINNLELVTHQENCLRRSRGYGYEHQPLSDSMKILLDLI